MLTVLAIVAGIVVGGTIGLLLLIALLGALQDRARGVTPLVARLTREGVPVGARSVIHAELSEIGGKLIPFALIGLVFGVPVLALGWNEASAFGISLDELPYFAPGVALLGVGVLLLVAGRAKLQQSKTYVALIQRRPEAVWLEPTSVRLRIQEANLAANATGHQYSVLRDIPHVVVHYRDGSSFLLRSFDDRSLGRTLAELAILLPGVAVRATSMHHVGDDALPKELAAGA